MGTRAWMLVAGAAVGCGGKVSPDPAVTGNGRAFECPKLDPIQGSCADFHLMNTSLTCGGDGMMQVSVNTVTGGAQRYVVQLMNGSRVQGSLVHNDPPCNITNGTDADATFGVVYTGDQGVEPDGTPCIVQSNVMFSSFNFDLVLMAPHEGLMKDKLHRAFDTQIIKKLYGKEVGRCARWREMPPGA